MGVSLLYSHQMFISHYAHYGFENCISSDALAKNLGALAWKCCKEWNMSKNFFPNKSDKLKGREIGAGWMIWQSLQFGFMLHGEEIFRRVDIKMYCQWMFCKAKG